MTTRLNYRNLCRRRLGDLAAPYHWSDLQINQWINDAIADYSLYFPRLVQAVLRATPGVHAVPLPVDFRSAVLVEFPTGQDTAPGFAAQLLPGNRLLGATPCVTTSCGGTMAAPQDELLAE